MTVILSCNSNLAVKSQVFAAFTCMGIPAPTSRPSLMLTNGYLSTPWQATQKLPFKLQKIKRGQEH